MNKLHTQWQRLYSAQGPDPSVPDQAAPIRLQMGERVRAMVLAAKGPSAWRHLAPVWQGVQADLGLPAPAIAVNGVDGIQLWFSVSSPVARNQAEAFLRLLRRRYVGEPERQGIGQWPAAGTRWQSELPTPELVPAQQSVTRYWSAYVTSDLASIFADEPWLDVSPNPDAQADMLARMDSIPLADFLSCCPDETYSVLLADQEHQEPQAQPVRKVPATQPDPRQFLLEVMNNPDVSLALRVEAAKALMVDRHAS